MFNFKIIFKTILSKNRFCVHLNYIFAKWKQTDKKKIAGVLQEDLANVLQNRLREAGQMGILISVSKVTATTDLSIAKVYASVFPSTNADDIVKELNAIKPQIKHEVSQLTKHQLRRMPELFFYNDDSLDYIEKIDEAVKGEEDPLKNPDLLPKRRKS